MSLKPRTNQRPLVTTRRAIEALSAPMKACGVAPVASAMICPMTPPCVKATTTASLMAGGDPVDLVADPLGERVLGLGAREQLPALFTERTAYGGVAAGGQDLEVEPVHGAEEDFAERRFERWCEPQGLGERRCRLHRGERRAVDRGDWLGPAAVPRRFRPLAARCLPAGDQPARRAAG